ncbi:c-type cytochrome [Candidatus Thioglobus sp.]|uniref:c-type cytochrome n=1 Tax=Candidatus Thioglobus sp. TaxID=2026721 RepID=UPI003D12786A
MNNIIFSIFTLAVISATTISSADELSLSQSRWAQDVYDLSISGDVKKGKKLAKKCDSCHGDNGVSEDNETPSLAGQKPSYTFKQMYDYQHKIRKNKTMFKKVKKLSYQDMADISAWYQAQKSEKKFGTDAPKLVTIGDEKRFLIGCDMCHNPAVMTGGFQVPTLEGQKIDYLIETLGEFKEGDRNNDEYKVMQDIAKLLSDEEIEMISKYYAAKPIIEDD